MAIKYMTVVVINGYQPYSRLPVYEYSDELSSGGNGDTVIIPPRVDNISVILKITSGEGRIEASTSTIAEVLAGTGTWTPWVNENVTETTEDACEHVTALRQVNISGTTKMELRAK